MKPTVCASKHASALNPPASTLRSRHSIPDRVLGRFAKVKKGEVEGISDPPLLHDVLSLDDVAALTRHFENVTSEEKPQLTSSEFSSIVTELSDEPPRQRDLDAAFVRADVDNSGGIDKDEFLKLYALVKKGEVDGLSGSRFGWAKLNAGANSIIGGLQKACKMKPRGKSALHRLKRMLEGKHPKGDSHELPGGLAPPQLRG